MYISSFKRSLEIISDEAIILFFKKALRVTGARIFRITRFIIFELDIVSPVRNTLPTIELSFRMASEEDIDAMDEEHYDYDEKAKRYSREGFRRVDVCVLAFHKGAIVGYVP